MRFDLQTHLLAVLCGLLLIPCVAFPQGQTASFEAVYSVSTKGFDVGVMTRRLQIQSGQRYRFETDFRTTGLAGALRRVVVTESSIGLLTGDRFRPERYRYRKESGKKISESGTDFDWGQGLASGFTGTRRWELPLRGAELDKVVYQLALAADLQANVADLRYAVPDGGKRQELLVKRVREETLVLPLGEVSTIRVEHRRRDGRSTSLWCDPARGYMPVQIEYREKDGSVTLARLEHLRR